MAGASKWNGGFWMSQQQGGKWRSFLAAFFLTMAVLSIVMVVTVLAVQPAMPKNASRQPSEPEYVYRPQQEDSLTLLAIQTSPSEPSANFLLLRFNPQYGQIPLSLLPPETLVPFNQEQRSLQSVYEQKGAAAAKEALAERLGIVIDRYAKLDSDAFLRIAQKTGTVVYTLPYDIAYTRDGFDIHLSAGERRLDAKDLLDLLAYPPFQRNTLEKSELMGEVLAALINQNLDIAAESNSSGWFLLAINLVDTDITYADYELRRQAADFLSGIDAQVAASFTAQGEFVGDGTGFALSDSFCELLRRYFQQAV